MRTCKLQKGDRILCVAPLVNMTGVGVNYVPWLLTGGTLVLHHPLNMQVLLQQLTNSNVHFTILVPAVLNMIIKLPVENSPDLSSIRTIATGSAPPSSWAMIEFKKRWGIEIINIWGQNEGTGLVAGPDDVPDLDMRSDYFPFWGKEGCSWPSGVEGIQIKILGENGQEVVAPGEVGELCYRSPFTFPGYFRRPDLTERSFTKDGYFRTGDLFILHDSCHVGFYDRKKDIVIRGGFNISSAEVENIVLGHPKVAEAAVVPMPDEVLGERVCLFVVPREKENPPSLEEIVRYCREQGLSVYKLPERLEIISALPRNPVGKILKSVLKEELAKRRIQKE
ncbi:class I adenylate-forming enzyme family protein [Desulfovirgula thermocuniculi]|uniref:class I adenylate-forming enzyme family protein n=1 Tax=Desulfovirgula thermocuniculi TaxID=348842 RepID=UPI001B7FA1E9|nr:fatty acid--CoA ligase family protein [Desulfovirgula thermocuniculi]